MISIITILVIIADFLDLLSFVPNAPFLYPLKTSENRKAFWYFQEVEKGCIENEWVNSFVVC